MDMTLLKEELMRDEGLRTRPYRCPAGTLTIGVGRNIEDVGITREEARILLENDIARVCGGLDQALPWWRQLSEARQRAVANMCFNLGLRRLLGFRQCLRALERGAYEEAARQALDSRWARQVGGRAARVAQMIGEG